MLDSWCGWGRGIEILSPGIPTCHWPLTEDACGRWAGRMGHNFYTQFLAFVIIILKNIL